MSPRPSPRRSAIVARRRAGLAVVAVLAGAVAVGAAAPAGGQSDTDLREKQRQLEQVREERAQKASQVDVLQADSVEVREALADLEANVNERAAALANAQRKEAEAIQLATQARAAAEAKATQLAAVQSAAAQVALKAYMAPPQTGPLELFGAADINAATFRQGVLASQSRSIDDVVDELGAARQDLDRQHQAAEAAEARATERRQDTEAELAALQQAQAVQQQKANDAEARLEAALAESQALADTDAQLSAQIEAEQAQIAAQLAELQRRAEAGGAVRGPVAPPGGALDAGTGATPGGDVALVTVGGITVNAEIGGQLEAMLAAAAADGVALGGGGYRSSDRQVQLRIEHCGGNSSYAIYQRPSSQCRPPTARPGQSMHERGLAIDFTCNGGGTIQSRSSPCYQWLAAHAAEYGFRNLPSETWHWSTTGQ